MLRSKACRAAGRFPFKEYTVAGTTAVATAAVAAEAFVVTLRAGDRVLVVEDETLPAMEVCDLLRAAGVRVKWVSTLDAAFAAIEDGYEAAVLDVNVGGQMVFPIARKLAAKKTPFVYLTGYDNSAIWPSDLCSARLEFGPRGSEFPHLIRHAS
jgi:hypothetical protein